MPTWNGPWSESEATTYLEEKNAPIRLACHTKQGNPWVLSLWYTYRDGAFHCATGANARVVEYLRGDDRVAVEVSDNTPPYRGVRGAGTASVEPDEDKELLRELLERYLDGTDNRLAEGLLASDREEVRIRIDPDRLYTWDFTDRMSDVE